MARLDEQILAPARLAVRFPRRALAALLAAVALIAWPASESAARKTVSAAPVETAVLENRLIQMVSSTEDTARGGFVSHEGVPDVAAVELAWRLAGDGEPGWAARARRTCDWTWSLYDSVGGGLLESLRDTHLHEGGFEKHTDSNSRRLENFVDAWLDGRRDADRRAVLRELDFFERVLVDGRGGFVAGQSGDRDLVPAANGLAIHAYLTWAAASGETHWRDFAFRSIDRVWSESWDPKLGLLHRDPFGNIVAEPKLDDQVELGRALALATHVGGRPADLARTRQVADLVLARFEDTKQGGMRTQAVPARDGTVKKAGRESWGNARAARFLAEVASVTGEGRYRDAALRLQNAFAAGARPGPESAEWALAVRAIQRPDLPARPEWREPAPVKSTPKSFPIGKPKAKPKHGGRG
jgi:uncharacterized protein YyaL (SSP411 family)